MAVMARTHQHLRGTLVDDVALRWRADRRLARTLDKPASGIGHLVLSRRQIRPAACDTHGSNVGEYRVIELDRICAAAKPLMVFDPKFDRTGASAGIENIVRAADQRRRATSTCSERLTAQVSKTRPRRLRRRRLFEVHTRAELSTDERLRSR
jgi:hypothetical protein